MLEDYRSLNQVHAPPQLPRCDVCRKTLGEHQYGRWCRRPVRPTEADRLVSTLQLAFPLQDEGLQSLLGWGETLRPIVDNSFTTTMAFVARALNQRSLGPPSQPMSSIEPEPERSVKGSIKGSEADSDSGPECEPEEGGDAETSGADSVAVALSAEVA